MDGTAIRKCSMIKYFRGYFTVLSFLLLCLLSIASISYAASYTISTQIGSGGGGGASIPDQAAPPHKFFNSITSGTFGSTQPALADLSDASSVCTLTGAQFLTNKSLDTTTTIFKDTTDPTKTAELDLSGLLTAHSITLKAQDIIGNYTIMDKETYNSFIAGLGDITSHNAADFLAASLRGAANGVAPLDAGALIPLVNLPTIPDSQLASNGNLMKLSGTNTATGAYDFTGASVFKILVNTGVIPTPPSGTLYCNASDNKIHYACGNTIDTAISQITASAPLVITAGNIALAPASQAQGDILYFDGVNWVRLAAGTSGQLLKTNGASANPSWGYNTSYVWGSTGANNASSTIYLRTLINGTDSTSSNSTVDANISGLTAHIAVVPQTFTVLSCATNSAPGTGNTFVFNLLINGVAATGDCTNTAGGAHNGKACTVALTANNVASALDHLEIRVTKTATDTMGQTQCYVY